MPNFLPETLCLIVSAHPLTESLAARLAARVETAARAAGWQITPRDLYADGFDPRLTGAERVGYYTGFKGDGLAGEQAELAATKVLILVFPTWWSGFPAILKGWFDRVWAPGTAFDHSPDLRAMIPRLTGLHEVLVVTTMVAPGWIDWLILWRSQRRLVKWGIVRPCAPKARFRWHCLYRAEAATEGRIARFEAGLTKEIATMARRLRCPD